MTFSGVNIDMYLKEGYTILIEGLDGVGKTTIAKHFQKNYPKYKYVHESGETIYSDTYLKDTYQKNVILDRTIIGELIWPEVYNRTPQISVKDIRGIVDNLTNSKYIILYLSTDIYTINRRVGERGERITYNLSDVDNKYRKILLDIFFDKTFYYTT